MALPDLMLKHMAAVSSYSLRPLRTQNGFCNRILSCFLKMYTAQKRFLSYSLVLKSDVPIASMRLCARSTAHWTACAVPPV